MNTFFVVLTACLLLLPGITTSFCRPVAPDVDRLVRRRRIALWIATAVALALFGLVLLAEGAGWLGSRIANGFRGSAPSPWPMLPFLVLQAFLWWPFAGRVFEALRPEWAGTHPPSPRRTASLTARSPSADLPRGAFVPGWVLFGFAAAAVAVRMLHGDPPAAIESGAWWPCLLFLAAGAFPLVLTPLVLRAATAEPEPLDEHASTELLDAYADLRRLKARSFVFLAIGMSVLFGGLAAAVAWIGAPGATGLIGGIGGAVVGVSGGAFGAVAGSRRLRIRRRLEKLTAREEG